MSDDGSADRSVPRFRLIFFALVIVWFGLFSCFPQLLGRIGLGHYGVWFLDTFAILASSDAAARGLDPWAANALDYFNRPHVYSHWWFRLHDIGLTRATNFGFGLVVVGAFLLAAVYPLKPRSWREIALFFLVVGSPAVVLAVNRANNDLVIFALLAPVVSCLLSSRRIVRFVPVLLVALATGLKFYPIVAALMLLAAPDLRERNWRATFAFLVLALVAMNVAPDLVLIGKNLPQPRGLMTFGVAHLLGSFGLAGWRATALGLAICGGAAIFLQRRVLGRWAVPREEQTSWLGFILGATLLTGCFFAGANYGYRWIFAIWLAPLMARLPFDLSVPMGIRRLSGITVGLVLLSLWADPLLSAVFSAIGNQVAGATLVRWADRFEFAEQPLQWVLFTCLLAFLLHFIRHAARAGGRGRKILSSLDIE